MTSAVAAAARRDLVAVIVSHAIVSNAAVWSAIVIGVGICFEDLLDARRKQALQSDREHVPRQRKR